MAAAPVFARAIAATLTVVCTYTCMYAVPLARGQGGQFTLRTDGLPPSVPQAAANFVIDIDFDQRVLAEKLMSMVVCSMAMLTHDEWAGTSRGSKVTLCFLSAHRKSAEARTGVFYKDGAEGGSCTTACSDAGGCSAEGLSDIDNDLTFRQATGMHCEGVSSLNKPWSPFKWTGSSGGLTGGCYSMKPVSALSNPTDLRPPECDISHSVATRVCACLCPAGSYQIYPDILRDESNCTR
jgi:hypothetical protein